MYLRGGDIICERIFISAVDELWAKKSDKNSVFKWLPLYQHLIDVTEVMKLLWEHWLSSRQRQQIINSLSEPNEELAKNLVGFLAATHDLGKATPVFQSRPSFHQSPDLDNELLEKLEKAGFRGIADYSRNLMNPKETHHALAGQILLENFGVSPDITSIVGAHHGMPPNTGIDASMHLRAYRSNYYQEHNQEDAVHRKWVKIQKAIFDWALRFNDFESVDDLPQIKQPGQVLLSGLLIMADWIGSNEDYFPLLPIDQTSVADPDERKRKGWQKWYKTRPQIAQEHMDIIMGYEERFEFTPHHFQIKLFDVIQKITEPGIIIVEAPMGLGKTEAALIGVEQLSAKTQATGMFFGLPTQATSDGMFDRIQDWLLRLDGETKSLQLVHGKAALNESFSSLPRTNIYDEQDEKNVVVNDWFAGRKTAVLDDFVVGTVDQFLMSALQQKHLALRHLGFSKKVIVIDEVHAYDAYMSQYLCRALRWMGAYNVPVIVLSATLPVKTRIDLVESYMRGTGQKWRDVKKPEDWETTKAYPLITYTDGMAIKQFSEINVASHSEVKIIPLDEENLISILADQLSDGGIAGIIVNTVKRAQEVAAICSAHFGEDTVELLHSHFIATHRIKKEQDLLKMIGKGAKRPAKKIVVGTQVIEQSLDIDFDLLISDLAPIDLLIQRVGRLHRHLLDNRPEKLKEPKFYVMGINADFEFESGSSAVYGNYLLMRSQLLLPEKLRLPQDISPLVQAVYGAYESFIQESYREKYNRAKAEHEGEIERKQGSAKGFILDKPKFGRKTSLIGWLNTEFRSSSEERAYAQVRDIKETIEVIALKKFGTGYTLFDQKHDLSTQIHDPSIQKSIFRSTIRLPLILSTRYNIEDTISELEDFYVKHLFAWEELTWLKGMLAIVFDDKNEFLLNGYRLKYCLKQGLTYGKLLDKEGGS